jgi:hypothetical protein
VTVYTSTKLSNQIPFLTIPPGDVSFSFTLKAHLPFRYLCYPIRPTNLKILKLNYSSDRLNNYFMICFYLNLDVLICSVSNLLIL